MTPIRAVPPALVAGAIALGFIAAALVPGATRADTVRASSTTLVLARQDWRDGSLQTAVPLFQLIDLDASEVKTPYGDLEVGLSTWGSADLADIRFWQNGGPVTHRFTGDINAGFIRADLLSRALTLKVGRQMVADGIARMVQIDGAQARIALPSNFSVSGYAGSPVSPRFVTRGGDLAVANVRADFAGGGRVSWRYATLLDVGASVAVASDHGDPSRRDVGFDFRVTPHRIVQVAGTGWWSFYEGRLGEASGSVLLFPARQLDVTVDYRHVEPDLFLPRNSILSVFVSDSRNDVGAALHWTGIPRLAIDLDYHALLEDVGAGHLARIKGTLHPEGPPTTAGAEISVLKNASGAAPMNDNGYELIRIFGAREILPRFTGTLDFMAYFFDNAVNGERQSISATATLAYGFARGWRATLAGTAGSTPYLATQLELMAKLVYEQTYAIREVKP